MRKPEGDSRSADIQLFSPLECISKIKFFICGLGTEEGA